MEERTSENNSKKRARDDSGELESNSPELKRANAIKAFDPNPPESERVDRDIKSDFPESNECQHDSEGTSTESNGAEYVNEVDSPEVKKFREDILDIFDEPEMVPETQDLDSVIRSFEEEILHPSPSVANSMVVELTSYSGESQPDLGYLLEASDDELGLPPTVNSSEGQAQNKPINVPLGNEEAVNGLGNMVRFEDELQNYDSFEFGLGDGVIDGNNFVGNGNGDFVTVDGLFDYSDESGFSDFAWRPEFLPAL